MAIAATMQWEVRPTSASGVDNGGGWDSAFLGPGGVDRSQQPAPQVVIDNVAITCTTPAANSNTLTFTAGYTPSAADLGNVVAITGGVNINTGLYEITAQNGLAPPNGTWTVTGATNLTTAGGAGSAITGNMGGARKGFSNGTTPLQGAHVAGNIIWVKDEAWNEAVNLTVAGTVTAPVRVNGYGAGRGDAGRATNNRGGAGGVAITLGATRITVANIIVQASGGDGFSNSTFDCWFFNCKSFGNTGNGWTATTGGLVLLACESNSNTGRAVQCGNGNVRYGGCWFHANTSTGPHATGTASAAIESTISSANGGAGVSFAATPTSLALNQCTIDGNTGAATDGLTGVSFGVLTTIANSIFSNNGRDGMRASTGGQPAFVGFCDFWQNGGAPFTNFSPFIGIDTLDPQYVDATNGNFAIGANLRGQGYPGVFPGAASQGFLDIGAVQSQGGGGGGGGRIENVLPIGIL